MERTTTLCVWFLFMVFLGVSISGEGQQHPVKKTRSAAVVVGTVFCDTCFNSAFKSPHHLISGALVAVECLDENSKPSFRQEVKTNEHGEFKAKLPFSVSKHVKKIKRCSVKLLSSSQPYCSIAASATSSSLKRLKSSHHGENTRVFSAGFFTFKPENQPEICSQKPINLHDSKPLLPDPTFPPPIQDPVPTPSPLPIPNLPLVPPLPNLPVPSLPIPDLPVPQIPPVLPPGLPTPLVPPVPQKSSSLRSKKSVSLEDKKAEVLKPNFFLPPNPLNPLNPLPNPLNPPIVPLPPNPLNPPSLIPPNPLIPSPPTLPLPPLPFQPPPSSVIPPIPGVPLPPVPGFPTLPPIPGVPLPPVPGFPSLPPVPGLTPPSLPPPSSLPIPLPFPPLNPGNPPASPSLPIPLPPIIPGVPPALSSFSSHHQP